MTTDLTPVVDAVTRSVEWLDAANGRDEQEITWRVGKVAEELGEAWAAWIGVVGQNPRKGVTHTKRDVADELADVVLAALTVLQSIDGDAGTVITKAFAWLQDISPKSTSARMLHLTCDVGNVAAGRLGGDRTVAGLRRALAETVFHSVDAIRSLGLDPAQVLTEKAHRVSARIAGQQDATP
ncbi:MazG-like family protein [Cryptosporangium minutisporangium]|uniref:NTP pyrophosphohydrolase MazG putative catalytic core domain-containing protein n=1 Tax=Cryptosporangium minutisporangium TaxID=113569 RepID=A0ABP6T2H2_9ACTN